MSLPHRDGPRQQGQLDSGNQPPFGPLQAVGLEDIEEWHSVSKGADASSRTTRYEARMGSDVRGTWPSQVVDFGTHRLQPMSVQQHVNPSGGTGAHRPAPSVQAQNAWTGVGRSHNPLRAVEPAVRNNIYTVPLAVPSAKQGCRPVNTK